MLAKVILLALCANLSVSLEEDAEIGYTNCGPPNSPELLLVDVEGCEKSPCEFIGDQSYAITIQAKADRTTANLPLLVKVIVVGIPITILEVEACDFLTEGSCSISNGEIFTVSKDLSIGKCFPGINVFPIRFEMSDDRGNELLCVSFKIKYQSDHGCLE